MRNPELSFRFRKPTTAPTPFTTIPIGVNLSIPGTIDVYAADFIGTPGGYSDFTVSKSMMGEYGAAVTYTCADSPGSWPRTFTVYVRSSTPSVLTKTGQVTVSDSDGWCA